MWPVAILLIAVVEFYWLSFCFTLWAWVCAIADLLQGKFIRASIWFSLGCGMLFWWMGTDIDFDRWLHGSYVIVGLGALATFVRFYNRHRRAAQAVPPFEPAPFEPAPVTLNININIDPPAQTAVLFTMISWHWHQHCAELSALGEYPVRPSTTRTYTPGVFAARKE